MNNVHLIGRLANDVEVKEVNGGYHRRIPTCPQKKLIVSILGDFGREVSDEADLFQIKSWESRLGPLPELLTIV